MLRIRQAQIDAMRDALQRGFGPSMVAHLRQYFPRETAALDDEQLLAMIADGKKHARAHGADSEQALCRFIDIRFAFGEDFDSDPRYEWIAAPLRDPVIPSGDLRIEEMALRAAEWTAKPPEGAA